MDYTHFNETMEVIVSALKERGYDPYLQICGYLSENDPSYITSHNGARELIQQLDKDYIKQFLSIL